MITIIATTTPITAGLMDLDVSFTPVVFCVGFMVVGCGKPVKVLRLVSRVLTISILGFGKFGCF